MSDSASEVKPFKLEFANRVIEHLGIKLYQNKPTNVVAEFVSNAWDADANNVAVELTAHGEDGTPAIVITDDGRGMTRTELTDEFLVIGRNRRKEPGDRTPKGRLPMGRKGIGKLAGFGIARTIDVLAAPNPMHRDGAIEIGYFWLRFSLQEVVASTGPSGDGAYAPTVIADGVDLVELRRLSSEQEMDAQLTHFLANAESGKGGVCVYMRNTTLKRAMNVETLIQSMGRRFTVSMLRPDFVLKVNGKEITPEQALPPLHAFGFGDWTSPITETINIQGVQRSVRYWVKFVSLQGSDWSIENAGVGVFAHGKIAQDRPFFFDVKGKEILSRYLYAVLEADWLDELPDDVVSTDRRSIDWDNDATQPLFDWGSSKTAFWLEAFRKWRTEQPKTEIIARIRKVRPNSTLTGAEEEALAELLSEVIPNLANDEEAKDRATKSFTEAWTHLPTRMLTKSLWERIFSNAESDSRVFAELVEALRRSMVPEAMGLAVTMAQRVAAITVMRKMIEQDKTETHLQRLIESFPWLLGPQYERLTANESIKTLVTQKHRADPELGEWSILGAKLKQRPDFVFLGDPGTEKEFVVFELNGPEAGKTLQQAEYEQLSTYLRIIRNVYPDPSYTIRGVLVGHDGKLGLDKSDTRIEVKTWSEILSEARHIHVSYLQALLVASQPGVDDIRLKQIADFGGPETIELLQRLQDVKPYPNVISESLAVLTLSSQGDAEVRPPEDPSTPKSSA